MQTMIQNYWTTVFGALAAIANQASGPGFKIPSTKSEWIQTALSFLFVALGVSAKDATTGSKPQ